MARAVLLYLGQNIIFSNTATMTYQYSCVALIENWCNVALGSGFDWSL